MKIRLANCSNGEPLSGCLFRFLKMTNGFFLLDGIYNSAKFNKSDHLYLYEELKELTGSGTGLCIMLRDKETRKVKYVYFRTVGGFTIRLKKELINYSK